MRILILGDGLLGSELASQTGWPISSRKLTNLDILSVNSVEEAIKGYDTIVNCIANTNTYLDDFQSHNSINYEFVKLLVELCNKHRIKLIHISTEFVYALNAELPSETDDPKPANNWYAKTKLLADKYIQQHSSSYLICRELHKPNPFPYNKVWRVQTSGDLVDKIAELIVKLVEIGAVGLYNVGTGSKCLSDLAPSAEVIDPPHNVPTDTRMNLQKLNKVLHENNITIPTRG